MTYIGAMTLGAEIGIAVGFIPIIYQGRMKMSEMKNSFYIFLSFYFFSILIFSKCDMNTVFSGLQYLYGDRIEECFPDPGSTSRFGSARKLLVFPLSLSVACLICIFIRKVEEYKENI